MADTAELKALIAQSLESKGILGKIKAQLRASVVTAINEYEGNSGMHQENIGAKKIHDHFEAQIGLGLVCEFLEYYGFQYALSVLLPEAGLGGQASYPGTEQIAHYLRLPLPHPQPSRSQPLLVDLIASKSPLSNGHPPHPNNHNIPSLTLTSAAYSPHSSSSPHTYSPHSSSPHSPHPQSPRSEGLTSPRSPRAQPTHWPASKGPSSSLPSAVSASLSSVPAPSPNSPTIKKLAIPSLTMPQNQTSQKTATSSAPIPSQPSISPSISPSLNLSQNKSQSQPATLPTQKSTTPQTTPQPKSIPQPQPIPTKPEPASKSVSSKNKEAAYLSYPEGDDDDDDDIDEDIDEDLDDLDGDLDFEDDDEDIEIDATPQKKDTDKKPLAPFPSGAKSLPLSSLTKPSGALLSLTKDNGAKKDVATKPSIKDRFDIDEEDAGSLEEDMKRLEVIEKKLNLFTKPTSQPKKDARTELPDDLDSIGSEDYSHSFEDDDALTIDHSIESDRSSIVGDYDHEEYIDSK